MRGPNEEKAHRFADSVDAFILTYEPPSGGLRAVMQTPEFDCVGAAGTSREDVFAKLLAEAEGFAWPFPQP